MTLQVWRNSGRFFVVCDSCFSHGTPHAVEVETQVSSEVAQNIRKHRDHVMGLRAGFEEDANEIVRRSRSGTISNTEAAGLLAERYRGHVEAVLAAERMAPPPPIGGVREIVRKCPWCDVAHEPTEVERLADNAPSPIQRLIHPPEGGKRGRK